MMDNFEQILGALRGVKLSLRERRNMRLHLEAHVRENPLRETSPVREWFSEAGTSIANALNSRTFATHPVFVACVLVLCVGVGTSYAAQNALPGQALYSFKTRVNEPIQGAFAVSPAAKAEWSAELTDRRLKEAEELAAMNQLSPVATADIETGLNAAIQDFNSSVALVSKSDDVEATNAQSDLEASLNAHETVLSALPTKQKNNASHITSLVRSHADSISKERSDAELALIATDSPSVQQAALSQQKSAEKAVKQVNLLSKNIVDTQVASSVVDITEEASSDIKIGDSDAKKGKWGKAYGAFQDALRKVKETQQSVDTRNWLKAKFGLGLDLNAGTSTDATSTAATSTTSTTTTSTSSKSSDSNNKDSND